MATAHTLVWLRRDLRLDTNPAIQKAIELGLPIQMIFIFDTEILEDLPEDDARVSFIHNELAKIDKLLRTKNSSLKMIHGSPIEIWKELSSDNVKHVVFNSDFEPYALDRDEKVKEILESKGIAVHTTLDHLVFKPGEVLKDDGDPYTVYTPFRKKWEELFHPSKLNIPNYDLLASLFDPSDFNFLSLEEIGFKKALNEPVEYNLNDIASYNETRNFPAKNDTSRLGPHLRFGTVSVHKIIEETREESATFLSELIWREFFIHILYFFPESTKNNFRSKYDGITWRNDKAEFEKWCEGNTGYEMVDAGMRELNETGYMHNRVRMIVASFLCKHLLIHWRWGEAYFAQKLLDFELASNVGNWQWAAGTGCDAAPYFRVFNPITQAEKFDPEGKYRDKWVPERKTQGYPEKMVNHKKARERALEAYKVGIE